MTDCVYCETQLLPGEIVTCDYCRYQLVESMAND